MLLNKLHKIILLSLLGVCELSLANKPNIIVILTDDQGYADVGFRDNTVHTPHIDSLIKSGVELKRFYTAPVCSPTRAGIMTGLYPLRFGMQRAVNRPFSEVGLPEELVTLPEALGQAGYSKRYIVGKWHLGNMKKRQLPLNHGFNAQYGPYCSGIDYFNHTRLRVHDFHRDQKTVRETGYYTDLLSDEVVSIINKHDGSAPFFIYLPYGAPHTPLQAPSQEMARYRSLDKKRATYLAMISVIDKGVGRILAALDRKGLTNNTFILFLSDNGAPPWGNNEPWRGRKGSLFEGGIRVIAGARWPGQLPAGTVCEEMSSYVDVMPTLLDAAGALKAEASDQFDGRSVLSAWKGQRQQGEREHEFYSFYEKNNAAGEGLAIIKGNWKLIRQGPPILKGARAKGTQLLLYDLNSDIKEENNLADQYPKLVKTFLDKLIKFRLRRSQGGVPPMVAPYPDKWKPYDNWEPVK